MNLAPAAAMAVFLLSTPAPARADDVPWPIHVIDNSSKGADGVRLADVNGDGRLDIATGWEEGGVTRVYLHPGPDKVKGNWPAVTVGRTPDVEDAVPGDLDGDRSSGVIACCEGADKSLSGVRWTGRESRRGVPVASGGPKGTAASGRGEGAASTERWTSHEIAGPPGSKFDRIELLDMDGDGDLDVMTCEEREGGRGLGVFWYENRSR